MYQINVAIKYASLLVFISFIKCVGPNYFDTACTYIHVVYICFSRNGLSESAIVSKTFFVEWSEPDAEPYEDDDQSFIMDSRRPKSSMRVGRHFFFLF